MIDGVSRSRPSDTSARADEIQFEILRGMTVQQRAEIFTALTLAVQDLALAGMRERFPNASVDELRLRLAVHRLGAETVRRVWGWKSES
jgi:hypothetical protein